MTTVAGSTTNWAPIIWRTSSSEETRAAMRTSSIAPSKPPVTAVPAVFNAPPPTVSSPASGSAAPEPVAGSSIASVRRATQSPLTKSERVWLVIE